MPALAVWGTAALAIGERDAGLLWGAAGIAALVATGLALLHRRLAWRNAVSVVVLSLSLCGITLAAIAVGAPARLSDELVEAGHGGEVSFTAVVERDSATEGSARVRALVTEVRRGDHGFATRTPATLFIDDPPRLGQGDELEVRGRMRIGDPGDERPVRIFADGVRVVGGAPPWLAALTAIRGDLIERAGMIASSGAQLVPGLAVGDTSAVSPPLDAAMKVTALSHLTAVSGANCAIITALVVALARALGLRIAARVGLCIGVLIAYALLVTPDGSVLRATVMAIAVLLASMRGARLRGLPALSIAVIVLVLADPWVARSYGFVLSVLATTGLLLLARPLSAKLERWLPRWAAMVIAIPLAAELMVQPVLLTLDASLSTYGVLANVLVEPLVPLGTVLGLLACLMGAAHLALQSGHLALPPPLNALDHAVDALANGLVTLAVLPASWLAGVASELSSWPLARMPLPFGGWSPAAIALVEITIVVVAARVRAGPMAALALTATGALIAAALTPVIARVTTLPSDWQLAACDVGQGDAVLVRSAGQVALIDTGPKPLPLARCLGELGIEHLDLLVLTHFDLDHVGGADAVIGMADRVLTQPAREHAEVRLLQRLADGGARVEGATTGLAGQLGALEWRVLWPTARVPASLEPGNDTSIAMSFVPGEGCADCLSALFLADLGASAQRALARATPLAHVDVVKVAHHGSADQEDATYRAVHADLALISVGAENRYGHPTAKLLAMLADAGTPAVRTDVDGLVLVRGSPGAVSVWSSAHPGEASWASRAGDTGHRCLDATVCDTGGSRGRIQKTFGRHTAWRPGLLLRSGGRGECTRARTPSPPRTSTA